MPAAPEVLSPQAPALDLRVRADEAVSNHRGRRERGRFQAGDSTAGRRNCRRTADLNLRRRARFRREEAVLLGFDAAGGIIQGHLG